MMGESSEMINDDMSHEDNGYYYGRSSEMPGNNTSGYQINSNYVQDYQLREKNANQQILESQKPDMNTINGKDFAMNICGSISFS